MTRLLIFAARYSCLDFSWGDSNIIISSHSRRGSISAYPLCSCLEDVEVPAASTAPIDFSSITFDEVTQSFKSTQKIHRLLRNAQEDEAFKITRQPKASGFDYQFFRILSACRYRLADASRRTAVFRSVNSAARRTASRK